MTDSPSVLLERAAHLIERRAAEATQGTWTIQSPDHVVTNIDCGERSVAFEREEGACDQEDARWICMMAPPIAAPLVAWLRYARTMYEMAERRAANKSWDATDNHVSSADRAALELARTILGVPSKDEEPS